MWSRFGLADEVKFWLLFDEESDDEGAAAANMNAYLSSVALM